MSQIIVTDVNLAARSGDVIPDVEINFYSALTLTAYFRAINFISENMARFPRVVLDPLAPSNAPPHPLDRLLGIRPNGYQNGVVFWRSLIYHLAHTGNGYARIDRAVNDVPIALHNLSPDDVKPFRFTPEGGTTEQFYLLQKSRTVLHSSQVLHLSALSWDGMTGMDPITLHEGTFQRASVIDRYITKFNKKGTVINGAIEIPGHLEKDQLSELRAFLRTHFAGDVAENEPLILIDGGRLNNATLTPDQSKLIEQQKLTVKQICQITGVPPEVVFEMSDTKYINTVEAAGEHVVKYTFGPLIAQVQAELTLKLLSEADQTRGLSVQVDPDVLLVGSPQKQTDTVAKQRAAGLITGNEGRSVLGWPKSDDPDADKLKISGDTGGKPPSDASTPPENPEK